ncbi:MAG: peptidoglycan DD-metalloendopeptidase family protein [Microcystaceae cyanobacterium]
MKDVFTTKVTLFPSDLMPKTDGVMPLWDRVAEISLTPSEGYRRVRRSAAMLGLALSMGASGLVLSSKATAETRAATPETTISNVERVPATTEAQPVTTLSSPVALRSQTPSPSTVKIASLNAASDAPQAIAVIPPLEVSSTPSTLASASPSKSPLLQPIALKNSSNHATAEQPVALASPATSTPVTVSDVSQPIQVIPAPDIQGTLAPAAQQAGVVTLPAPVAAAPQTGSLPPLARPIPIQVPAPEQQAPPTAIAPIKREETEIKATNQTPTANSNLPALQPVTESVTPRTTVKSLEAPVAIAVIPPATVPETTPILQRSATNRPIPSTASEVTPVVNTPAPPQIINPVAETTVTSYQVQSGDTLNNIARDHGISKQELIEVNGLDNPNLIRPSQKLVIPSLAKNTLLATTQPQLSSEAVTPEAVQADHVSVPKSVPKIVNTSVSSRVTTTVKADQPIPIAVEMPASPYTAQLKSEVASIPVAQTPKAQPGTQRPMVVSQAADQDTLDEAVNPEWQDERVLPRSYTAPRASFNQLQQRYRPTVRHSGLANSPIIGTAPANPQDYNDSIRLPVGQEVSPELPPLNAPQMPEMPTQYTSHIWPARGVLTSGFGRRWGRMHKGIDIAAPVGTPIFASAPGEVIAAGWNSGGFGNLVKIRHYDGSVTYYAHNSRILVRPGQIVAQGEQVAEMGSTGRSTGPHLHFEIRPNGEDAINPIALLPQR